MGPLGIIVAMAVVAQGSGPAPTDQEFLPPEAGERVLVTLLVPGEDSPTGEAFVVEVEGDALRRPHNVASDGEPPLWVVVAKGGPALRGDIRFEPRRRPNWPRGSSHGVEGPQIQAEDVLVRWRWPEGPGTGSSGQASLLSGTITTYGYQETPYLAPDGLSPPPLRTLVLDVDGRTWHGTEPTGNPDLNNDGRVNLEDLSILLTAWGEEQPPPAALMEEMR